jgi:hypothetical protein
MKYGEEPSPDSIDALAITVNQQLAKIPRAPTFLLTASDVGGHVPDERLPLNIHFL